MSSPDSNIYLRSHCGLFKSSDFVILSFRKIQIETLIFSVQGVSFLARLKWSSLRVVVIQLLICTLLADPLFSSHLIAKVRTKMQNLVHALKHHNEPYYWHIFLNNVNFGLDAKELRHVFQNSMIAIPAWEMLSVCVKHNKTFSCKILCTCLLSV